MTNDDPMVQCIYCLKEVPADCLSTEHAVPRFLGGARAPEMFKLRSVCRNCNSRLGTFVDGSFARSWFVTNSLALAARRLYLGETDPPLPLVCMGAITCPGLSVPDGYVSERWLGPFGDNVLWVRPHDESLYWYSGGNPIDEKSLPSTAYLLLAVGNVHRWRISIASFLAFFKSKKIRKILCAQVL